MAGIQVSWEFGSAGPGNPPDPVAAESHRGWVQYRDGWRDDWQFDDESTSERLGNPDDMPNGAYTIAVCGFKDGVLSVPTFKSYTHTTGTDPIDPVFGDPPPAGDESVASPTDLVVTEAP